jgi:hypothetical protein
MFDISFLNILLRRWAPIFEWHLCHSVFFPASLKETVKEARIVPRNAEMHSCVPSQRTQRIPICINTSVSIC